MIISFSSLGKHGRLGNQLFQIASTFGMAEKYGARAVFPSWSYAQYFENYLPTGRMASTRIEEKHFHHHEWNLTGDTDLHGYLQSPAYFGVQRLRLKQAFVEDMKSRLNIWDKHTICLQVRRGDYVGNENYYQVPITYYIQALNKHFPGWQQSNILVISDDIEYCKVHFECLPNVTFAQGNTDIEEMALASNCDDFIISNSTFGWWTAWFGCHDPSKYQFERTVIYPGRMFTGKLAHFETRDYWPIQWFPFSMDDLQLDLRDVTFTMPVSFDHEHRRRNLGLSLCMLQKDLKSNHIICEQGGNKFADMKQFARYIQLGANIFHRTKMLNMMAQMAETPYIVNWDVDVIISPVQLWAAANLLRKGIDVVYPFDGKFARIPRNDWFQKIQKYLDIGVVGKTPFKGREPGHMSSGGAVMFNKRCFVEGGMENQNMISFGPEDWERHNRFKTLGYSIGRVGGALFHLDHFVGPNSSSANPHFRANTAEYEKVNKMTPDQLRAYIATWPWPKEKIHENIL